MTDKEFAATKRRIRALALPWIKRMGLGWWTIHLDYARDGLTSQHDESACCQAHCSSIWQYLTATVTFSMPACLEATDDELENTVVHELCHVLVSEMREWSTETMESDAIAAAVRHEERVVCCLTNAFIWTRKGLP